jgi:hypothetical protein
MVSSEPAASLHMHRPTVIATEIRVFVAHSRDEVGGADTIPIDARFEGRADLLRTGSLILTVFHDIALSPVRYGLWNRTS